MKSISVRWRLTSLYAAVLLAFLIAFGVAVFLLVRSHLLATVDAALAEELVEMREEIERAHDKESLLRELAIRFSGHEGYEFRLDGSSEIPLFQSDGLKHANFQPVRATPKPGSTEYKTMATTDGAEWRLASRQVASPWGSMTARASIPLAQYNAALSQLLAMMGLAGSFMFVVSLGGGYLLARQALAPVDRMVNAANEINAENLHRRIEVPHESDELGRLANTLNDMMSRLHDSFEEIRRFTADAAHELRTPLAVMRSEVEVALGANRSPEEYQQILRNQLEEIGRLTRLVSQLLFLCRQDSGQQKLAARALSIRDLLAKIVEDFQPFADEKGIQLELRDHHDSEVRGDVDLLHQLFFNLLDNAIKFSEGTTVRIRNWPNGSEICVSIEDDGVGIATAHLPFLFQRFYRASRGIGHSSDGMGLGLAICQSIATVHGGSIAIDSKPMQGTRVVVTLPASRCCQQLTPCH